MDIINITNVDFRKLYSKIINRITNKNLKILGGIDIAAVGFGMLGGIVVVGRSVVLGAGGGVGLAMSLIKS